MSKLNLGSRIQHKKFLGNYIVTEIKESVAWTETIYVAKSIFSHENHTKLGDHTIEIKECEWQEEYQHIKDKVNLSEIDAEELISELASREDIALVIVEKQPHYTSKIEFEVMATDGSFIVYDPKSVSYSKEYSKEECSSGVLTVSDYTRDYPRI